MGKHRRVDSLQGATSTGAGRSEKTRGHGEIGLFVVAENIDPGQDTLRVVVEFSVEGIHFAQSIRRQTAEDALELTQDDLEQSDNNASVYVGHIADHNLHAEHIRANITGYDDVSADELTVDAYVFIGGWTGRGKSYKEREDTPEGQLGR